MFLVVDVAANALALVFTAYARFVRHLGWPYKSPFLDVPFAGDLHPFDPQLPFLHSSAFLSPGWRSAFPYPAPLVIPYAILFHLPHEDACFIGFTLLFACAAAFLLFRALWRHTAYTRKQCAIFVAGLLVTSYPLAFDIRQGNVEFVVVLFVFAGIWAFVRGKDHPAAALLGIAASMKLFPLLYLGLFLSRRRFPAILTGIGAAGVATLTGLFILDPSLASAWYGLQRGGHVIEGDLLGIWQPIGYDHSLFGAVKLFYRHFVSHTNSQSSDLLHVYLAVVGLAGLAIYFLRIRRLPWINQITCLTVCSILLPPLSYDYTLLHLYVPIALLALYTGVQGKRPPHRLLLIMSFLAILTASQAWLILHGQLRAGQFKALVLLALLYALLREPLAEQQTWMRGMAQPAAAPVTP